MCVYLRAKFQVSSIILTSLRQGRGGSGVGNFNHPPPPQNKPLKSPPRLGLINFEITLILTWSKNCFLVAGTAANQEPTFKITGTELYVLVVTLSTQDNVKLLKQSVSGFKGIINWNIYQSKVTQETQNRNLDFSRSK